MSNPLKELAKFKVSPWFDNLSRRLIDSGELERMIREDGLMGITSNPTIFQKAIDASNDYDAAISALIGKGQTDPKRIFEFLAVEDVGRAADLLRGVYNKTGGLDGFVSLEVSPELAHDTEGTVHEAKRLHAMLNRPNIFIKVPATKEGVPAIAQLLGQGIPVNVTLIFALARYEEVMDAYIEGLERYEKTVKPLSDIRSVASFFISRIDSAVDAQLKDKSLMGKAAIANAKLAYEKYKEIFSSPRFQALAKKGARVQRPLWASTSTKNPEYRDVLYVEELIGPDTVDTMPDATWVAFRDHGKLRNSLEENVPEARKVMDALKKDGVDFDSVTRKLEAEGVASFAKSYETLIAHIASKTQTLKNSSSGKDDPLNGLGSFRANADATLKAAEKEQFVARLWKKEPGLWKKDPKHQAVIADSLGWLDMPDWASGKLPELSAFAEEIRKEKFQKVLLLGMGGSSLAPEVFSRTFGARSGWPELLVLDSTDPEAVAYADKKCDPKTTLYIVSSKSGTTTEPLRFFDYFWSRAETALKKSPGDHFVAITDPGSFLAKAAGEKKFRRVFENPSDIGGRYSALSYFGMVPAALAGVDLKSLLDQARQMKEACASTDSKANPGLRLGCALGALAKEGRDKITFLVSPALASLGLWLEQLIAESTGKEGKGAVPISDEPRVDPRTYGKDRVFVHIRAGDDTSLDDFAINVQKAGHPVIGINVADRLGLGAEFFRWEIATAALGWTLGIDPFDQPNVQQAKDKTKALLDGLTKKGELAMPGGPLSDDGFAVAVSSAIKAAKNELSAEGALERLLGEARPGDYIALLPYVSPWVPNQQLSALRTRLVEASGLAVQFGFGPRYLHSTGQLHKGGPATGLFILLLADERKGEKIPGSGYGFAELISAQALGDFQALDAAGRRAVLIRFKGDPAKAFAALAKAVAGRQAVKA